MEIDEIWKVMNCIEQFRILFIHLVVEKPSSVILDIYVIRQQKLRNTIIIHTLCHRHYSAQLHL